MVKLSEPINLGLPMPATMAKQVLSSHFVGAAEMIPPAFQFSNPPSPCMRIQKESTAIRGALIAKSASLSGLNISQFSVSVLFGDASSASLTGICPPMLPGSHLHQNQGVFSPSPTCSICIKVWKATSD